MEKKVLEELLEKKDYIKILEIQEQEYEEDRRKFNEFVQREKEFDERMKRINEESQKRIEEQKELHDYSHIFPLGEA